MNGTPTPFLEIHNLSKHYEISRKNTLYAVDNVSFKLEKGTVLGLVGESGCGKSTLARMISRLIQPTTGHILLYAQSLSMIPPDEFTKDSRRKDVQLVFQDSSESLDPSQKVIHALIEPLRNLCGMRDKKEIHARCHELAELTGLDPILLNRYPHQLSGGQKARIGIARALAPQPKLLILDEPTAALDASVQAVVLQLLNDLRKKLELTMIFVSHDLHVIRLMSDWVAVMYSGKIVEFGPSSKVTSEPKHPYTKKLLASVPGVKIDFHSEDSKDLGEPISPINPKQQTCRYASRCPKVQEICRIEYPELKKVEENYEVSCHFSGEKN